MLFFVGLIVVIGCVVGGYMGNGGHMGVLWQPFEFVIIFGAAFGAFIIGNPSHIIKDALHSLKNLVKGTPYNKSDYSELLGFLYNIFKVMKTKGMLQIEADIDKPESSELFTKYPKFAGDHHNVAFVCDYLRMLTMGVDNHYQLEDLMVGELDSHHHHYDEVATSLSNMADGMPALGIVAAVLGVIHTMGSITEPPEVLGHLIGGALVGTFMGVFISYGFVAPMAAFIKKYQTAKGTYLQVVKAAIIAHVQGNAPMISVETARKIIPDKIRPSFSELDQIINGSGGEK
ncbi:MAG: flagellar motor stator protein MotA [Alphaproteobacteria bacterium]|nr:flagellar motor stator protein MotA [Alphaproteobacteria bacterium]